MSGETAATVFATVGSVLSVVLLLPQTIRTIRYPWLAGVSVLAYASSTVSGLLWAIYGVRIVVWPLAFSSMLVAAGSLTIAAHVPGRWPGAPRLLMLTAITVMTTLLAFVVPVGVLGTLASVLSVGAVWLQVFRSFKGSSTDRGVSLLSIGLRSAASLCWLTYAVIATDVAMLVTSPATILAAGLVLTVETARRRRSSDRGCKSAGE